MENMIGRGGDEVGGVTDRDKLCFYHNHWRANYPRSKEGASKPFLLRGYALKLYVQKQPSDLKNRKPNNDIIRKNMIVHLFLVFIVRDISLACPQNVNARMQFGPNSAKVVRAKETGFSAGTAVF